jgi:hypothetical protein
MDITEKQLREISHTRLFASPQFTPFSPTAVAATCKLTTRADILRDFGIE